MLAERRGDDHDVHRIDLSKRLRQIGVQVDAVDGGRVRNHPGIDRRDELHCALVCEPRNPFSMDLPVTAHSHEDQARWVVS